MKSKQIKYIIWCSIVQHRRHTQEQQQQKNTNKRGKQKMNNNKKKQTKKKAIKVCTFYYFKMVCVWRIDEDHSRSLSSLHYPQRSKVLPGFDQWYYQTLACRQRLLCSWGRKCYWMICKRKSDISMRHLIETFYKWVDLRVKYVK